MSHEASKFKEDNEALRGLLYEIDKMDSFDRVTQWGDIKRQIAELLKS
jgi:hypothetical protein